MTVAQIKKAIKGLDEAQLEELRQWLWELNADEWDRRMKRDAEAGKLDSLAESALQEHRAGRTRPLPAERDIDEADVA